jgi:predicted O-methyltransferase YrrM
VTTTTTVILLLPLLAVVATAAVALLALREVRRARAEAAAGRAEAAGALETGLDTLRQQVRVQHQQTRAVVDALHSLSGLGADGSTHPSTQGWSASPMVLRQLAEQVAEVEPDLVVELGGGGSSVLLGRLLRRQGHGRVVSLEHDPAYAEVTRAHLRRHGVEDLVDVRVAPLVDVAVGEETYQWYDPAAVADLQGIDLVFVDGPPGSTGRHARFPAVPVLRERLSPAARVLLDDGGRRQERKVADRWIADHGASELAADDVGTGWIQLRVD